MSPKRDCSSKRVNAQHGTLQGHDHLFTSSSRHISWAQHEHQFTVRGITLYRQLRAQAVGEGGGHSRLQARAVLLGIYLRGALHPPNPPPGWNAGMGSSSCPARGWRVSPSHVRETGRCGVPLPAVSPLPSGKFTLILLGKNYPHKAHADGRQTNEGAVLAGVFEVCAGMSSPFKFQRSYGIIYSRMSVATLLSRHRYLDRYLVYIISCHALFAWHGLWSANKCENAGTQCCCR